MHRFLIEPEAWSGEPGAVHLEGEEARHAIRVKRVRPGEPAEVMDGAGRRGTGTIGEIAPNRRSCSVDIVDARTETPLAPRLEVWSAAPKGDRLETMIDHLSQVGATAWVPVRSALTARELTDKRGERLRRVAGESLKQCGRSWALEIHEPVDIDGAWDGGGARVLVADASGVSLGDVGGVAEAAVVRLVVGPEGGWTADELAAARAAGAAVVSFGPHVMRIGTAAVVGAGVIRAL